MDKALVVTTISENRDRLNNISKEIWANPEGSFEEKHAHDILTQFFTEEGFEVERNYISATGFRATFGSSEGESFTTVNMTLFMQRCSTVDVQRRKLQTN